MTIRINNKIIGAEASNAILTIQKNGDTIDTFGANSLVDKTVNITVPTTLNELTDNLGNNPVHTHSQYSKNIVQTRQNLSYDTTETSKVYVNLSDNITIYSLTPTKATTFAFNTTNINLGSNDSITFELKIIMSTVYTMTFPSSLKWQDDEAPEMTEAGTYYLAFRSDDGGTTWLGNLQGLWS